MMMMSQQTFFLSLYRSVDFKILIFFFAHTNSQSNSCICFLSIEKKNSTDFLNSVKHRLFRHLLMFQAFISINHDDFPLTAKKDMTCRIRI